MQHSPTLSTTAYLMDVKKLNAQLSDDYAAWRAGAFRVYVLRPHTMEALKQATADQLTRRQIFIAQIRGRAYKTEWQNIKRILKEREQLAQDMLDAATMQANRLVNRAVTAVAIGKAAEAMAPEETVSA
jgi:hypothetical protein